MNKKYNILKHLFNSIITVNIVLFSGNIFAIDLSHISKELGIQDDNTQSYSEAKEALQKIIVIGKENNFAIKRSLIDAEKSKIEKDAARAKFLPSINASATTSWSKQDPENLRDIATRNLGYGINLSQNLFNGWKDRWQWDASEVSRERSELKIQSSEMEISMRIEVAVIEYIQAQGKLKLAQIAVKISEEVSQAAERRFKAGISGKIDLIETRTNLKLLKNKEMLNKHQEDLMFIELLALLQINDVKFVSDKLSVISKSIFNSAWEEGSRKKLDSLAVQTAQKDYELSEIKLKQARANRYAPSLDFGIGLNRGHSDVFSPANIPHDTWHNQYQLSLTLSVPIWNPSASSQIYQSAQENRFYSLQIQQAEYENNFKYEKLLNTEDYLVQSLPALKDAYESSAELYQAQLLLYDAGTSDLLRVLNSANNVVSSLETYYSSLCDIRKVAIQKRASELGINI